MASDVATKRMDQRPGIWLPLCMAAIAAAISVLTLIGYAVRSVSLVNVHPEWQAMSVSTAFLCLGLASALWADAGGRVATVRWLGIAVLAASGALLVGNAITGHDAVSPIVMGIFGRGPIHGETSLATAFCTGLLAVGCLGRPRAQPAATLSVIVVLVSGLAFLGYSYGVNDLYALSPFRTMSLRTAVTLLALGLGFLMSNRESGVSALVLDHSVTGQTTRRQLGFLILPPVMAFLLLKATAADRLGPGAAMAFLVVLTIAPLAALILRDARSLTRLDQERQEKHLSDLAKLAVERRYRTLFTRLETGFCVIEMKFDPSGKPVDYRFLEINPAFAGQTGLKDAEGKWMLDIAPRHEQHWFDLYGRVAMTGEPVRVEFEGAALGRHFEVSAFRIDEPELRHVAVLFNDISDRKRAELDLKALNETLERRVAERAAELEAMQEALRQSQKLEAIGQLTGGVAHDFNNLLTVIQGSVDMLRRPSLTEERRIRFTDAIAETAGRAAKLTSQMLAFARRQSLRPETFDIGCVLTEADTILSTLTGPIVLDFETPAYPCFVHADRAQFDAAIVNMVVNARDAMEGGGRIVISAGPVLGVPALRSHAPIVGDFIAVAIRDSGRGIASENIGRIFEPFFTTKGVGAGTGLGLSQVIGFAKQSGGDVRVDSAPGAGSTFTLYLPREYAEPARSEAVTSDFDVGGNGVRVLVVEDNILVGEFATQSLKELGYHSALAPDAERALAILSVDRSRYDIVFSDVVMPGRGGLELAEDVSRLYPDLPVVLTSGYSHVLSQNGTFGFELLHKPYSIEQLSRVMRKVLAWAQDAQSEAGHRLEREPSKGHGGSQP